MEKKSWRRFEVGFEVVEISGDKVTILPYYKIDGDLLVGKETFSLVVGDSFEFDYQRVHEANNEFIRDVDYTDTIYMDDREWASHKKVNYEPIAKRV